MCTYCARTKLEVAEPNKLLAGLGVSIVNVCTEKKSCFLVVEVQ